MIYNCCHGIGSLPSQVTARVARWRMEMSPVFLFVFIIIFPLFVNWILFPITVSGTCNKSHVLIFSGWFHQASYTLKKENYEVLFIVSITDISADKLKFVWLTETLLLGYISLKWLHGANRPAWTTTLYCQTFGFCLRIKLNMDFYLLMLFRIIWDIKKV